ncbi:hypothetical protein ACMT9Y_13480 [Clavibacter tessellarius]|uniref:hypothetical protein n=1 Tax=Clavibacter tessellarius TaxID=31965 RepID=UPI0039E768CF
MTQEQQDDAAFQDVFARYVNLSTTEETDEELSQLLTGDALQSEIASVRDISQKGESQEGKSRMSAFEVTSRGRDPQGVSYMVAQACLDVSGTRILDSGGRDVTPKRDDRLSLQMKAIKSEADSWRISDSLRNETVHACD